MSAWPPLEPQTHSSAVWLIPCTPRALPVNLAEGKASAVCAAAQAESERTLLQAKAKAKAIRIVARSLELQPRYGETAVRLTLATEYVKAFGKLAQGSNTLVVPADAASIPSMISQAMAALDELKPTPRQSPRVGRIEANDDDDEDDDGDDDDDA